MIAAELLALLVCPVDGAPVHEDAGVLVCDACSRRYPILEGEIPVMIPDEVVPESPDAS